MATKPKDSSSSSTVVGNEKKKAPSSTSHLTATKRTTKPTTTISTTKKSTNSTTPNNLKPTLSFKQPKSETPTKPAPIRRRSLDKPISSATAKNQPSSRLHKALVSPGPRERNVSLIKSLNSPVKTTSSSKPISDKTPIDAKTKLLWKKATPNSKKVANVHASSANTIKDKSVIADTSKVETKHVKEVEVIKVENEEHASHQNISPDVNSEVVHENKIVEDSDPLQNQGENEEDICTKSDVEEAEEDSQEKPEEHEEKENNNGNQQEEVDHSELEGEVAVNESGIVTEDQKNESNIEEEEEGKEKKEVVEEAKVEAVGGKGKKESQVSNDIIEETASKLLEGRKNKVLALAGAFQTVIDHQTK